MLAYDGSSPIRNVPTPMMSRVAIRLAFRPKRSPIWPNSNPPSGRDRKPDAKAPKAAIVPTRGLWDGKKTFPKTSAEAVAKM